MQKLKHAPNLNTILMVEDTIQKMEDRVDGPITVAGIKKNLPRQVNHNALKEILEYLAKSGKILYSPKGITWIYATKAEMQYLESISTPYEELLKARKSSGKSR